MKRRFFWLGIFILGLSACSRHETKENSNIFIVKEEALQDTYFYSGIVQPLKTVVITSPADGVIVNMNYQYGDMVKGNDLLFEISSEKFVNDYKSAFMTYLKAKNDFDTSKIQLEESNFLHKHQLISDDDYKSKASGYYAAQLTLLQAKDALEIFLHAMNIHDVDLYKLTIADIDKINQAMHLQTNSENLKILAPSAGIMLSNMKEDENKKLGKGDTVKQGDVLAVIGDFTGISVKVKVNELTINHLKIGQAVKITGIGFPDIILNGQIAALDRQAEVSNSDMPTFTIQAVVPNLTPHEQDEIHVGMSAKVEIATTSTPQITIPIAAVKEKNGDAVVTVLKNNHLMTKKIITGKTTLNDVAVLSGLNVGDKLLVTT